MALLSYLSSVFSSRPVEVKAPSSFASPEDWHFVAFGAAPSSAGPTVTPKKAMTCPPVRCAVRAIADAVGQLPFPVNRRLDGGGKDRATDHPVYRLLNGAANEFTPANSLRSQLTEDALLQGSGFAFINRVEGRPVELLRLIPTRVEIKTDEYGAPSYFLRTDKGPKREIDRADIIHIQAPSGISIVHQARETIGLLLAIEGHVSRTFKNGGRPSGIISFKGELAPKALETAKAAWLANNAGENSGGITPMNGDATFVPISMSHVDSQTVELWNRLVIDIGRHFRIPPIFLMEFGRATWRNSEHQRRDFVDFTLRPWLSEWEGQVALKLFREDERDEFEAEFLLDDFLKGDTIARMQAYGIAVSNCIMNPNEARAMENRAPYEGGDLFANRNVAVASLGKPDAKPAND